VTQGGPRPGLVLIHGAFHTAACWASTVVELELQAPGLSVLAADLPGRGATPGDLRKVTLQDCVASVVEQIDQAGLDEVVIVAHSLGGLVAPGVVARLGASRVARLVLIAAVIPPEGMSDMDLIARPARWIIARLVRPGVPRRPPARALARVSFCNGMTRGQRGQVYAQLVPEAPGLFHEPVSRADLPTAVPRTWIMPLRDRANPPRKQRICIDNLGGVGETIEIDTCHDVMISEPATLASVLAERCTHTTASRTPRGARQGTSGEDA
jgi:pimeloyl-ACP methyl ester carboxylesterase